MDAKVPDEIDQIRTALIGLLEKGDLPPSISEDLKSIAKQITSKEMLKKLKESIPTYDKERNKWYFGGGWVLDKENKRISKSYSNESGDTDVLIFVLVEDNKGPRLKFGDVRYIKVK